MPARRTETPRRTNTGGGSLASGRRLPGGDEVAELLHAHDRWEDGSEAEGGQRQVESEQEGPLPPLDAESGPGHRPHDEGEKEHCGELLGQHDHGRAVPDLGGPAGPKLGFLGDGNTINVFHAPNAHTDGDAVIWFREADVVHAAECSTGDIFRLRYREEQEEQEEQHAKDGDDSIAEAANDVRKHRGFRLTGAP